MARYATMLTAAGSGYSRWGDVAVTRWREDATCDDFGSYVFLRDVRSGDVWSAGFQPSGSEPDDYDVAFNEDRAEFTRRDGTLTTTMEVLVSAEDDAEVRRISISNTGGVFAGNRSHVLRRTGAGAAGRRCRASGLLKALRRDRVSAGCRRDLGDAPAARADRARNLGRACFRRRRRCRRASRKSKPTGPVSSAAAKASATPIAVIDGRALSNTVGTVLDPIFALRRRIRIAPGATVRVAFWTMVAGTREQLLHILDKHKDTTAFPRAATLAWTQAQVQLHHLGVTAGEAALFQRLAGHVIYAAPALRPSSNTIKRGAGAQSGLWAQRISGDLPIVLLRIADAETCKIFILIKVIFPVCQMICIPFSSKILIDPATASFIDPAPSDPPIINNVLYRGERPNSFKASSFLVCTRFDLIGLPVKNNLLKLRKYFLESSKLICTSCANFSRSLVVTPG